MTVILMNILYRLNISVVVLRNLYSRDTSSRYIIQRKFNLFQSNVTIVELGLCKNITAKLQIYISYFIRTLKQPKQSPVIVVSIIFMLHRDSKLQQCALHTFYSPIYPPRPIKIMNLQNFKKFSNNYGRFDVGPATS